MEDFDKFTDIFLTEIPAISRTAIRDEPHYLKERMVLTKRSESGKKKRIFGWIQQAKTMMMTDGQYEIFEKVRKQDNYRYFILGGPAVENHLYSSSSGCYLGGKVESLWSLRLQASPLSMLTDKLFTPC